jgi:acyl-CoA thioester hydrolase
MRMGRIRIDLPHRRLAAVTIPVRITDINYGNHVGNDSLVAIIHEARMQWLQIKGYTELDICGTALIMSEIAVTFKNEAFYPDAIDVEILAGDISRVGFDIFYSLTNRSNNILVTIAHAKTGMICFNYKEKKLEPVPDPLRRLLSP